MISKRCIFPSCSELAVFGSYCALHQKAQTPRKAFSTAKRSSEGFYNTTRWKTLRKKHLEKQCFCVHCGSEIDLTVDHIQNADGNEELFFNPDNLQTLCAICHRQKTAAEIFMRKGF